MTNKERILKTLSFEKTDRTPFAVLNGQMWIAARHWLTIATMLDLPDAGAQMLGVQDFMIELIDGEEENVQKTIDFAAAFCKG